MTITDARTELAAALSTVEGVNVRPRGPIKTPRPLDGWVVVNSLAPAEFGYALALTALVLLSPDETQAEDAFDRLTIDLLESLDGVAAAGIQVEPGLISVGQTATPFYALTITATMEVSHA